MKKLLLFLSLILFFSCSVQKRKYQSGYYVSWHKKKSTKEIGSLSKNNIPTEEQKGILVNQTQTIIPNDQVFASLNENLSSINLTPVKHFKLSPQDTCDVLVFKDGTELKAKVIEISSTQIKYKKCDMPDGPMYVGNKSEFFMIKYANGIKEVIKTAPTSPSNAYSNNYPAKSSKKTTRLATISFIFGIIGFYPLIFVGGIVALVTSFIQLENIRSNPDMFGGEKKAHAGMIMGAISIFIWALIIGLSVIL